ncbi:MAG: HEAT repeat domain-containing protein [Cyanobacteriota bacterium]
MERVAAWGVENVVGFDFKALLEELARENLEEYTKTFFQEGIEDWRGLGEQEQLEIALGQALREFLQLVQQELEDADCSEEERQQYSECLRQFLHHRTVLVELGKPFQDEVSDADKLEQTWQELNLRLLPDEFDWKGIAKRYKKKVDAIMRKSKELLAVLSDEATAEVPSDSDWIGYRKAIEQTYGYLKLDPLHTSGYSYRLQLLNIFVVQDVHEVQTLPPQFLELPKEDLERLLETENPDVLPTEALESLRKNGLDKEIIKEIIKRHKQSYAQETARSVLKLIEDGQTYPYLVILGDPGSGKSSLVQYIALQWAATAIEDSSSPPLPLLIELRRYVQNWDKQKCQNFVEFCQQSHGFIYPLHPQQLEERLRTGEVFVLFDGLDEVFEASKREEVITEIICFTQDYPQVRVLVTSRVIGYQPQRLRDKKFRHFMLQDLELEQIQAFLTRWHELAFDADEERKKKQERLQQAIEESLAIRQLGGNPLLLTMMAILNRNQELPRNRAELYSQASKVLLQQWDVEKSLIQKDAITIDFKDKQAMLRRVAYQMQGNDKGLAGNLINAENLEGILTAYLEKNLDINDPRANAKSIVKQLRERNFILCFLGADYYAFVHRTFLEYFCAWEFVWRFQKEQSISLEELKTEFFGKHWQDESWHEVLLLIAGMIDGKFVGEIIDYLIEQKSRKYTNFLLAGACLSEMRNRTAISTTAIRLLNRLKIHDKDIRQAALQALITNWNDGLFWFKQFATLDKDCSVRYMAVQALVKGWQDDPDTLVTLKHCVSSDENRYVREAAVQELVRSWKDDPETLDILKHCATSDKNGYVRYVAVQALVEGWKDDPCTLGILKHCATSDKNGYVRQAALQALVEGWKDDPCTLAIFKQRAYWDEDCDVRQTAVQALVQGWKDDPRTLFILKQHAIWGKNWTVRQAAVQALLEGWKYVPEILAVPKHRAYWGKNYEAVRQAAVQALVQGWKDDPHTLGILKQYATWDENWAVRQAAVQALVQGWKDDPRTLTILKQRAYWDENWAVRQTAVQALGHGRKDDPHILGILKQHATWDENWAVRQTAVQALVEGWKRDPETLAVLKQRATSDKDGSVRQTAVQALVEGWKDDPETLAILKQRATLDKDGSVQQTAVQALVEGWKDEPGMFEFLRDRALNDPFERKEYWQNNPRQTALKAIIQHYPDHLQTLPLLQDRAKNDPDKQVREFVKETLENRS